MRTIHADQALLPEGWARNVAVKIEHGRISEIEVEIGTGGTRYGALLPAPANLHSHAIQRAMAGLTERRGPDPRDSFWTWRRLMYRFLDHLGPDDVEAIAAFAQMEMAEAGYAAVGEFHYLHHRPDGSAYDDVAEMSARIAAAAELTGVGLTLLPVLYQYGGCEKRTLGPGQIRFASTPDSYVGLLTGAGNAISHLPEDAQLGVAPHSLRAVDNIGLCVAVDLCPEGGRIHMHLAEQVAEVEEVEQILGARPVTWLLDQLDVGIDWCLIHCTQMNDAETQALARSGAVAGLCPITESSLGDGIFNGATFAAAGGRFGIGSDSNIRIALAEELRTLEYSQRLRDRARAVFATPEKSTGRTLFDAAATCGAQATARDAGALRVGALADMLALDTGHADLAGRSGDVLLDSYIFAGDDGMVSDVWSAGRHIVRGGEHFARAEIASRYQKVITRLVDLI